MSWLNTSMQTGFARSASEAMFPRLFPDVGWFCPSLNPAFGGTRLWDLSGRQNWGTLTNMANDDWVVIGGKYALTFDGNDDFVNFGNVSSLNSLPLSFSCWYRPSATTGARTIFEKYSAGPAGVFCFQNASAISFQMGGSGPTNRVTGGTLVAGEWYHVAATVSPTLITLYVNATSVGTPLAPGSANSLTQPFTLCATNSGISNGNGMIDDFRAYSRALTSGEVSQLYQIGRGNMPLRRRRRCVEQAAGGFKGYWARNNSRLIGAGNVS
jgi:hypothetical protein